jgi:hypothetical protein
MWKVVSTQFDKLERVLNKLSFNGFSIWKLIVLSPKSTRTGRCAVIVIGLKSEQTTEPDQSEASQNAKPWQGMFVDPEHRPTRRTGRFEFKEKSSVAKFSKTNKSD